MLSLRRDSYGSAGLDGAREVLVKLSAMISKQDVCEMLRPFQKHRQLSIREGEVISLEILTLLCDDYCGDEGTLKYLARLMTPELYADLVDERNLNQRCGYPLCSGAPERIRDPFSVDQVTKQFLWENNPYAYLSKYCNKFHFRCSQFFQVQLSEEAIFARTGVQLLEDTQEMRQTQDDKFNVTLFEELLREKASEEDIKSLVAGLKRLGLDASQDGEDGDEQLEVDLSKWLEQIKIVENKDPPMLGDLVKD